jgi:hypothetical protein
MANMSGTVCPARLYVCMYVWIRCQLSFGLRDCMYVCMYVCMANMSGTVCLARLYVCMYVCMYG